MQNKIICTKCKVAKGTTPQRYEDLAKAGKIENYVCRHCKAGTSQTKSGKVLMSKIVCSKCHSRMGTNPTRNKKLIALFGSIEEVHQNYVCRACRKKLNVDQRGLPKREKRAYHKKIWNGTLPDHMRNLNIDEHTVQSDEMGTVKVFYSAEKFLKFLDKKIEANETAEAAKKEAEILPLDSVKTNIKD